MSKKQKFRVLRGEIREMKKRKNRTRKAEPDSEPEILCKEKLCALMKLAYEKNYLIVGRWGIYGGMIQSMHLHWKKQMTVQICFETFAKGKLQGMGEQLERLIGELQAHMVNEGANRADRDAEIQNDPVTHPQESTDHQEREADKESDSTDAVKASEPNFKDWGDESESNSENNISSSDESDKLYILMSTLLHQIVMMRIATIWTTNMS
ncbi:unnamed protein product [Sphagnum balticum]